MQRHRLLCAIVLLVSSAFSLAQENTGKISGLVTDAGGAVIVSVPVTATNDGTGVVTTTRSSERGEYLLNFLVPGTYHVLVAKRRIQEVSAVASRS